MMVANETSMEDEFSSEHSSPFIVPCVSYSSPAASKKTKRPKDKKLCSSLAEKQRKRIPMGKPVAEETLGLVGLPILDNSNGSSNSLSSSPLVHRSNKNAASRPRAKTFSHSSSTLWESYDSASKARLSRKDKKSISVLCDLFQQQQQQYGSSSSPIVNRARHSNGLPTSQTASCLPFVAGSSTGVHQRQLDLAKSPYRTPLVSPHRKSNTLPGRFNCSLGLPRKQQQGHHVIPAKKAATLARLDKIPSHTESSKAKKQLFCQPTPRKTILGRIDHFNLQKSSSGDDSQSTPEPGTTSRGNPCSGCHDNQTTTVGLDENTLLAEMKAVIISTPLEGMETKKESFDSPSGSGARDSRPLDIVIGSECVTDVVDVDCCTASEQGPNPTFSLDKSGSSNSLGSNVAVAPPPAQTLSLPSILVRSATPCDNVAKKEDEESGQGLVEHFVMRAELAEELNKLCRDVHDIVETNKSIMESNTLDSSEP